MPCSPRLSTLFRARHVRHFRFPEFGAIVLPCVVSVDFPRFVCRLSMAVLSLQRALQRPAAAARFVRFRSRCHDRVVRCRLFPLVAV